MKKHICNAKDVVNRILDRDIVTVDYGSMPEDARKSWGGEAKSALSNRCIQHLIGKVDEVTGKNTSGEIVRRCIENIARYSKSQEETERIRHIMIGVELIRDLLQEMLYKEVAATEEDINAPL